MGFTWMDGRAGWVFVLQMNWQQIFAAYNRVQKGETKSQSIMTLQNTDSETLWALPWTENSSRDEQAGKKQAMDKPSRTFIKDFQICLFNFAHEETYPKSQSDRLFSKKTKRREESLIKSTKQSAQLIKANIWALLFGLWAHATRAIHWLTRQ